ncbi:MAG: hypothetical protein AAGE01_19300 [Pseudomonadota bacterium]
MMQRHTDHPIIGKTITGVIARPGSDGREIVMLQFDDGTCFEVVSSRARRALTRLAGERRQPATSEQMSFFPHDGELRAA